MDIGLCYLCNAKTVDWRCNLSEITSQHSKTVLCIFIKNFLGDFESTRKIENERNCICVACLNRIDEYDWLCETVKQKEQEMRDILMRTELFYVNHQDDRDNVECMVENSNYKEDLLMEIDRKEEGINEIIFEVKNENTSDDEYIPTNCRTTKSSKRNNKKSKIISSGIKSLKEEENPQNDSNAEKSTFRGGNKAPKNYLCNDCNSTFNYKVELNVKKNDYFNKIKNFINID